MDDLKSMAVFVRTVDLGSLAAAAEREDISPTMAGNHLRSLERKLGARLLNRTTRSHSLTEAGRSYYEKARRILDLVAEAHAGVEAEQLVCRGKLRIAAPLSFGTERLTPALGEFLHRFPEVSVELSLNDRLVDLVDEGFDAAFRIGVLADSALVARRLALYRMWLCASPDYLRRRGTPLRPTELAGHDCLFFSYTGGEWKFDAGGGTETVEVQGRFQVNSGQALRVAAKAGMGIILQPEVLLAEDVAAGRLVRLFTDMEIPTRPMNLIYLRDRHMPPRLRYFIDFVLEQFA